MKKFRILFCFVLAILFLEIPFFGVSAASSIDRKEFMLYEDHVQNRMQAESKEILSISEIKYLNDFDGNTYTLGELNPIGYFIYHNESGKFVEYGSNSPSPYLGKTGDLFYNGAKGYYEKYSNSFQHTIIKEENISADNIQLLSEDSRLRNEEYLKNKNIENLAFVQGNSSITPYNDISLMAITREVANASYFHNLDKFGYLDGGYCGYIGAAMVLGYMDIQHDNGFVDSQDLIWKNNRWELSNNLTTTLKNLGPNNNNGTTGIQMSGIVANYMLTRTTAQQWQVHASITDGVGDPCNKIDINLPTVLFGSFKDVSGSGKVNHAVVTYGYTKFGLFNLSFQYKVHYGWSGYNQIWLEGTMGSRMWIGL